jgi:O-antigen/teichoic acid export membrane protein
LDSSFFLTLQAKTIFFLSFGFLFSESLIFLALIILYGWYYSFSGVRAWHRTHITFGGKSLLLGFGNEVNSRMDIFFISFFLTSTHVGIYSFAASFIKGLLMLASAVQLNVNSDRFYIVEHD